MMVRIGNFLFHYRNGLFPLVFILLFLNQRQALPDQTLAVALGFTIAILGQLLRAITIGLAYIKRGGKDRQVYADDLVTDGMFSHCRNPLYVGNLLVVLGLGFIANSWLFLVIGVPFFIFAYIAIVAAEENFLRKKFGTAFDEYCRRVGRFTLNLAGFGKTWEGMEFKWRRLIVKEYGSTYAWLVTACALLAQHRWVQTRSFVDPQMSIIIGAFVLVTAAYFAARYLKKSRALVAD